MDNKKDKRSHIRIPLLSESVSFEYIPTDGAKVIKEVCGMADISNSGCFIKTIANVKPKSFITVNLTLPGDLGVMQVKGKVIWRRWAIKKGSKSQDLGMGVAFTDVSPTIQKVLDAYCVYLRNKQIITVSKRIIEEFFGPKEPLI